MYFTSHITCGALLFLTTYTHTYPSNGSCCQQWIGKKSRRIDSNSWLRLFNVTRSGIDDYLWLVSNSIIIALAINIYTISCWHPHERKWAAASIICHRRWCWSCTIANHVKINSYSLFSCQHDFNKIQIIGKHNEQPTVRRKKSSFFLCCSCRCWLFSRFVNFFLFVANAFHIIFTSRKCRFLHEPNRKRRRDE